MLFCCLQPCKTVLNASENLQRAWSWSPRHHEARGRGHHHHARCVVVVTTTTPDVVTTECVAPRITSLQTIQCWNPAQLTIISGLIRASMIIIG